MLNFLHISLAIAGILDAQIDRALSGLEARTQVSSEVWSQFRNICDAYLLRYQDRSSLPWQDYLNMLTVRYPKKLAQLRAAFALELQPLHTVEKHIGLSGKSRTAPTHEMPIVCEQNRFSEAVRVLQSHFRRLRWKRYAGNIQAMNAVLVDFATEG